MNPPTFFGSKMEEDPQGFIDEVFKILDAMGVSYQEQADLAAYQLEDLDRVWYDQLKNERPIIKGQITWGALKTAFLGRFFLLELRERKIQEFINLDQGDMSIKDYSLKFTQLYKHAPSLAGDYRANMNKFVM